MDDALGRAHLRCAHADDRVGGAGHGGRRGHQLTGVHRPDGSIRRTVQRHCPMVQSQAAAPGPPVPSTRGPTAASGTMGTMSTRADDRGGATLSSTRSTRAPFRTQTATGRATCAASPRALTTSRRSAPTRSGCRRSTRRRWPTGATTWRTTPTSTRASARLPTPTRSSPPHTSAGCACCSTSCRATPRSSTRGSPSTPSATSGLIATARRQLARVFRRALVVARRALGGWYLHPSIPTARPGLAPRRRARRHGRRPALLDRPRRRRLPAGRDRPPAEGPDLRDDPPASGPPALPEHGDCATLDMRDSRNAPDIGDALAVLREGAGDEALLVGEVYLPAAELGPYLEHVDVAFAFELLQAQWEASAVRAAVQAGLAPGASRGCSQTTTSRGCPTGWARRTCARRRCSRSRSPARCSSIRATSSGWPTALARAARRPRRPRPPPPPDALGRRRAARRLLDRRAVAARHRGRRRRCGRAGARPGLRARAVSRPHRAAPRA